MEVTSETINKVCASGMRAVTIGETIICAGDADVIIAGGTRPTIMPRTGRSRLDTAMDGKVADGLVSPEPRME